MPPKRKSAIQPSSLRSSSRTRTPTKKLRDLSDTIATERLTKITKSNPLEPRKSTKAKAPAKTLTKGIKVNKPVSSSKKTINLNLTSKCSFGSSKQPFKLPNLLTLFNSSNLTTEIEHAFLTRDTPKLDSIIVELRSTHSETLLKELQSQIEKLQRKSDEAIHSLNTLNEDLRSENQTLKDKVAELTSDLLHSRPSTSTSLIRDTPQGTPSRNNRKESNFMLHMNDEHNDNEDQKQMIIDMTEQITGHHIVEISETNEDITFRCLQTGKAGEWKYTLIVDKSENSVDMTYIPGFQDGLFKREDIALKEVLPDYFLDHMRFPMVSLKEMYTKLNKCMNTTV